MCKLILRKKLRIKSLFSSGKNILGIFKGTRKYEAGDGQEKK